MTVGDDIRPGDWVVIHSGFVLERISEARALDALAIRATNPDATDRHATDTHATNPHASAPHITPAASVAPHHKEMAP